MSDEPRKAPTSDLGLRGRRRECAELDQLLEAVRAGQSRLLVRGDAGVGKTALLDYLVANASRCRLERASGVESEMELPFAGVHQLCAPMLDHLGHLPGQQREALRTHSVSVLGGRRTGFWWAEKRASGVGALLQ